MREEKLQQYPEIGGGEGRGVKQIITKEYKGQFFNNYVEITSFIQA